MEVVKEFFSADKNYKAEILRGKDGLFQVYTYIWDAEWETWLQNNRGVSLADTEQSAIIAAIEYLRNLTGMEIE
jgi:hypothetical protein